MLIQLNFLFFFFILSTFLDREDLVKCLPRIRKRRDLILVYESFIFLAFSFFFFGPDQALSKIILYIYAYISTIKNQ